MTFSKLSIADLESILRKITDKRSTICIFCGSKAKISDCNAEIVICSWKGCKKRYSLWNNTIFQRSKTSKLKKLEILDLWMNNFSLKQIVYSLNLKTRKVIWSLLKKVSKYLIPNYEKANSLIGGKDIIVEVDESKFGKRKFQRGHHVEGVWVLGMVERTKERKIKLTVVDDRSKLTLQEKLRSNINMESIIYTDGWKGYNGLGLIFSSHNSVNHSLFFKDPFTGVHTNTIEGNWSGIKPKISPRKRTKEGISLYLTRFMIQRNEKCHPLLGLLKYLF
jgi:transposase-like protein